MKSVPKRFGLLALVVAAATLAVGSCDNFSLVDQFYRATGLPLAIYPAAAAVQAGGTATFEGTGGAPDYTYRVVEPGGGTIDPDTGAYTAPGFAGEFSVEVTDKAGESSVAFVYVVQPQALRITPTNANVLFGDTFQFAASGGSGGYTFSIQGNPDVGSVNSSTGLFSASGPDDMGSTYVQVTDGSATATASVYVYKASSATDVIIIPSPGQIAQGQYSDLSVGGGTGTYDPFVVDSESFEYDDGVGGILTGPTGSTGRYEATDAIGTVVIRTQDDDTVPNVGTVEIIVIPATPTGVVANGETGDNKSIEVSWIFTRGLPPGGGFRIHRSDTQGGYAEVTVGPGIRSYLDTGLSPDRKVYYEYWITAYTPSYESNPSASAFSVANP